ncbi:MAG: ABC transporter ATP-binding protein [Desulfobacteraceae bacterium]|jgi:branched-chain amino acid transport system ATP-binding protein
MLAVRDLNVSFGGIRALRGISLDIQKGRIVSVIGANGAGKSTLLKTIAGLVRPKQGTISAGKYDIGGLAPKAIVKKGLSLVPEGRRLFTSLSVLDNLMLGAYLRSGRRHRAQVSRTLERVYTLFPRLKERSAQVAGTLSGGEQQMVSIGRALMTRPGLLMLDEPSMGLAPLVIKEIFKTIIELNRSGVTILLVEQNAKAALEISTHAYVLETGRIVREGSGAKLLCDQAIVQDYLGGG